MEAALRRGDFPFFPPSGFSIHQELFPVPSFCMRTKRLCRDRLCLMEFCVGKKWIICNLSADVQVMCRQWHQNYSWCKEEATGCFSVGIKWEGVLLQGKRLSFSMFPVETKLVVECEVKASKWTGSMHPPLTILCLLSLFHSFPMLYSERHWLSWHEGARDG